MGRIAVVRKSYLGSFMIHVRAFALLTVLVSLLLAPGASARQTQLGVDLAVLGLFPVGAYDDETGPAMGALAGIEAEVFPGMALTVRSGYISHMERSDYSRNVIPILGGLKLTTYSSSLYLAGEAGRARLRDEYRGDVSSTPDNESTKTAWSIGLGSAADVLDMRVSLFVWDAANFRETMTIGVSLAFLFWGY